MRWATTKQRRKRKYDRETKWHSWFAWRPVHTNHEQVVWLEPVMRICTLHESYINDPDRHWPYRYMAKDEYLKDKVQE